MVGDIPRWPGEYTYLRTFEKGTDRRKDVFGTVERLRPCQLQRPQHILRHGTGRLKVGLGRLEHRLASFRRPNLGKVSAKGLAEYRAAADRAAVQISRLSGLPHATIEMFGRRKSHFFC
jgi:hypothetical protein